MDSIEIYEMRMRQRALSSATFQQIQFTSCDSLVATTCTAVCAALAEAFLSCVPCGSADGLRPDSRPVLC